MFQGGAAYLTVYHPVWGCIYLTGGLSRKAPHHHHLLSVIWGYANIMRVKTHKTSRNTNQTIKNWSHKALI